MQNIENKIIKADLIDWRKAKWLQNSDLKDLPAENKLRLVNSIKKSGIIAPFYVWQNKKDLFFLDGHHRQTVMEELEKEGVKIPDKIMGIFINCADRKEAVENVLVYSSIFANVTEQGLATMFKNENLKFASIGAILSLPNVDLKTFELEYVKGIDTKGNFLGDLAGAGEESSASMIDMAKSKLVKENYAVNFTLSEKNKDYVIKALVRIAETLKCNSNEALVKVVKFYETNKLKSK